MTQRGLELRLQLQATQAEKRVARKDQLKRKFSGSDSRLLKRMAHSLDFPIDTVKRTSTALTRNVFKYDSLVLKGPISDKKIVERCLFRQRVFKDIWNDLAIRSCTATPWTIDSDQKRQFFEVREFFEPDALSFGSWLQKTKSHQLAMDDKVCLIAMEAFLHIFKRFIIGISDSFGHRALSHVLVAPDNTLVGISLSDDGDREKKTIDHVSPDHTVLGLLGGEKWNPNIQKSLNVVCTGTNRSRLLFSLNLLHNREKWNRVYDLVEEHELCSEISVLEMQKRYFALSNAIKRGAIVK